MPFRPPIPTVELHEIAKRKDAGDVIALLWEIKRLRGLVLRANQVVRELPEKGGPGGIVLEVLRADLKVEPCVMGEDARRLDSRDY